MNCSLEVCCLLWSSVLLGVGASAQDSVILHSRQAWSGSFSSALMGGDVASAGDVNGDGYDDVIVGAPGYDAPGGFQDEGAAFVFLGGPTGPRPGGPESADWVVYGTGTGAELGTSVGSAGDVNGDGYDDVIVGAPTASPSGLAVSGAAYVFLGGPRGVVGNTTASAHARLESKQIQAHFGHDVGFAGDVNGDGYDDVIVGANLYGRPFGPSIPNQGSGEQGAAFVFLGGPSGIVGRDPASAHATLVPWADGQPSQGQAGMGYAVASAGDVNGDGFDDVVVGALGWNNDREWPGIDTGDPFREGAAFVFLGSASGVVGRDPTQAHARLEGNYLEAYFGSSVASAGDVNGDGFDDLLVGAPGYSTAAPLFGREEGLVCVFHGGPAGIVAHGPADAARQLHGSGTATWLGRAVGCAGDRDGDGFDDVLVSARTFPGAIPDDAIYNGDARLGGEGIAYLFQGGPTGVAATQLAAADEIWSSGQEAGTAGYRLAGEGDFDGDGRVDLLIGVPGWSGAQSREGAVFVFPSGNTSAPRKERRTQLP